jgi:hypothetical protein
VGEGGRVEGGGSGAACLQGRRCQSASCALHAPHTAAAAARERLLRGARPPPPLRGGLTLGRAPAGQPAIMLNIRGNRWCERIGGPHKSNGTYYVVNLGTGCWCQKCYDPECRCVWGGRGVAVVRPRRFSSCASLSLVSRAP